MNEEFLYYKVLDIICDKRASYFNWSYFDDNVYCYSLISEIFNDSQDFLSQEMTLFSVINDFLSYRIPFVINLTIDQYYDLGLLTYFSNVNDDVFESLYFVKDPFNESRLFILFSDDILINNYDLNLYDDFYNVINSDIYDGMYDDTYDDMYYIYDIYDISDVYEGYDNDFYDLLFFDSINNSI